MTPSNYIWPIYLIVVLSFLSQTRGQQPSEEGSAEPSARSKSMMYNYERSQSFVCDFTGIKNPRRRASMLYYYDDEDAKKVRILQLKPRQLIATIWEPSAADYDPKIECPVCHDEFGTESNAVKLTNCGHSFHAECLTNWSESQWKEGKESLCPVCRKSFQA